jgi:hypothetical protein
VKKINLINGWKLYNVFFWEFSWIFCRSTGENKSPICYAFENFHNNIAVRHNNDGHVLAIHPYYGTISFKLRNGIYYLIFQSNENLLFGSWSRSCRSRVPSMLIRVPITIMFRIPHRLTIMPAHHASPPSPVNCSPSPG